MDKTTVEHCVAGYFAALRAMDGEAWLACFAADAIAHDPVGAPPNIGQAALRQYFIDASGAFECLALVEEQVFVCGQRAAVKWCGEGTGRNGRSVRFEGIDVFEFNPRGKIRQLWGYWDPAAMLAELNG